MPEMREWAGLSRVAVSCQEKAKMGGEEGLPGAVVAMQKIMDMGGTKSYKQNE